MSIDSLEEILALAEDHDGRPHLVEVLRQHDGRGTRLYCWSTGRITASVRGRTARITRRLGKVLEYSVAALRLEELRRVLRACRVWERRREPWAAFFSRSAGFGSSGYQYYQPPGPDADVQEIFSLMMGHRTGRELQGTEDVVRLDQPLRLGAGISAVAELWRMGEVHGPKAGSLVGERLDLGSGLVFDARRNEAQIAVAGRGEVVIEEDEAPFIRAVVRVMSGKPPRENRRSTGGSSRR